MILLGQFSQKGSQKYQKSITFFTKARICFCQVGNPYKTYKNLMILWFHVSALGPRPHSRRILALWRRRGRREQPSRRPQKRPEFVFGPLVCFWTA